MQAKEPKIMAKGGNAGRNRVHNRRVVLDFIRANDPSGRAEIARSCGLSVQAVSNITEALESDGLLHIVGQRFGQRGKPAGQYSINPNGAFSVGIELRPDAILCAVLSLDGECIYRNSVELLDTAPARAIPAVKDTFRRALEHCGRDETLLLGTGIVMPGPFGVPRLSDKGAATLPGWDTLDTKAHFTQELGCQVMIENDATAAAISERVAGVATGIDTFCFIYFGTGLGLGVIANGHAQSGAFGNFGEVGHIITEPGGNLCACGNRGCLETYASPMSARMFLDAKGVKFPDDDALALLLKTNDPAFLEWIELAARHLSRALNTLENLFDPETIILGGAMPNSVLDALIERVGLSEGSVSNHSGRSHARLMRGLSGSFTASIGAAAMIIHNTTTPSMIPFN